MPAAFGCSYFRLWVVLDDDYFYYASSGYIYFGLFSIEGSDGSCLAWDTSAFAGAWKFAQAMAILATIIGIIALGFTLSLSCVSMPNLMLKILSLAYILAGACLILTLSARAGCGEGCSLSVGGSLAIVAPIIYFITAVLVFKTPLYDYEGTTTNVQEQPHVSGDNTTVTITELPDGSRKTVKTTIDEHGNKTIEETIEEPEEEEEEPEDDVEVTYLPDGSIKTTRITYDEYGNKTVEETIEPALNA